MNAIRIILSNIRLPSFNMNPPCEITTEFFYLCGHTVTSRHCRNDARLWRANSYPDPFVACDVHCPTRSLPTVIHMYLSCSRCQRLPRVPYTNAVRSDPGVDRLDSGELRRRQDFYLSERRVRLTENARAAFFRNASRRAMWETYRRLEHEWLDSQGGSWQERSYFMGQGGGNDDRLMISIDPNTIPEGDEGRCGICWASLRVGVGGPPVHLPCGDFHRYHESCIERWLMTNRAQSCPHCRHWFQITTFNDWNRDSEDFVRFFVDYQRPPPIEDEVEDEDGFEDNDGADIEDEQGNQ